MVKKLVGSFQEQAIKKTTGQWLYCALHQYPPEAIVHTRRSFLT